MFRQDMRRILCSPYFWASILVAGCFFFYGTLEFPNDSLLYNFETTVGFGVTAYILPLLACFAFADSYCVERKEGYCYNMLIRKDKASYCLSKITAGALSGFLVVFLGLAVFSLLCLLWRRGGSVMVTEEVFNEVHGDENNLWGYLIRHGYSFLALLLMYVEHSLPGAIWPVMALAVSVFTRNRYIIYIVPPVYFLGMQLLCSNLELPYLNPLTITLHDNIYRFHMPGMGWGFLLGVIGIYIYVFGFIFWKGVHRSLK